MPRTTTKPKAGRKTKQPMPVPLYRLTVAHPGDYKSHLEYEFADLWLDLYPGIDLHSQYKFLPDRRFQADFAHLPSKTIIEIQGGTRQPGMGHSTGTGIQDDYEKQQLAAAAGWLVIPLSAADLTREKLAGIETTISIRTIEAKDGL